MQTNSITYPAGALLRVGAICRDTKTGKPGLLPINRGTWYKWLKAGRVPPGRQLGLNTVAWPIEVVLAIGQGAPGDLAGDTPSSAGPRRLAAARGAKAAPTKAYGPDQGPAAAAARQEVPA